MGKKTNQARKRLQSGEFKLPSPKEVEAGMTPAGAWTAKQLAEWGVSWPPPKGWRNELRVRWEAKEALERPMEKADYWRFAEAKPESGVIDLSGDPRLACMAIAVATQCTNAGFGKQLLIDLREAKCPDCGAAGFNTGMGVWMHSCGAEWHSDGTSAEPCTAVSAGAFS